MVMSESYVGRRRAPGRHRSARRGPGRVLRVLVVAGAAGCVAAAVHGLPSSSPETAAAPPTAAGRGGPTPGRVVSAASGLGAQTVSGVVGRLPATSLRMTAVSRRQERPALRGCDGKGDLLEHANGQIPVSDMCELPFASGHRLRADAALSLAALDAAYRKALGADLCVTDSYRSLASQQQLKARKPRLAARPGTSEHGWGVAVDLCGGAYSTGTSEHDWLLANARAFGWDNPGWARENGSKPEPWHWEYVAAKG